MYKYTAQFHLLDQETSQAQLKQSISDALAWAKRPIVFTLGQIEVADSGQCQVEIASDAREDTLDALLKGVESRLPVRFVGLGWGWLLTKSPEQPASIGIRPRVHNDPYAAVAPQDENIRIYTPSPWRKAGWVLSITLLAIFILFIGLIIFDPNFSTFLDEYQNPVGLASLLIWVIFLSTESPIPPWSIANRIRCTPDALELKYWLRPGWTHIPWKEILSLDISYSGVTLWAGNKKYKFILGQDTHHQSLLVKTILERASLNHVGGNLGQSFYKRFDAS